MVQFGKKLKAHVKDQSLAENQYVDYKKLKKAIKEGCTEDQFQTLYDDELDKFVHHLDVGLQRDPDYVEMNRLALDNIAKKFDKMNPSSQVRGSARVYLVRKLFC
jgi:SPX domain protein involved in polyphosphate accumulation